MRAVLTSPVVLVLLVSLGWGAPPLAGQSTLPTFELSEVLLRPAFQPSPAQVIEITNVGAVPADLGETQLCMQQFVSVKLADVLLAPGASVRVHVNDSGLDTEVDLWLPLGVPNLSVDAGSLLLTRWEAGPFPAGLCLDPANVIDFVQWGAGQQNGADVATQAQRWPDPSEFLPVPGLDISLARGTGTDLQPGGWFRDASPTLGARNVTPTAEQELILSACTPGGAVPLLSAGTPALGNLDFVLRVSNTPPLSPAVLFIGVGHVGTPIPGSGGCLFSVDDILTQVVTATDSGGNITLPFAVPDDPALIGFELSLQTAVLDGGISPLGFQLSTGLALTF